MSPIIRIVLIVASVVVFVLMMHRIRREKILIADAVFWILFSAGLLILSIFPQIAITIAGWLGFYSPTNMVLIFIIFVLLIKLFFLSLHISHTDCQLRQMAQSLAILQKQLEDQQPSKPEADQQQTGNNL
jgi:hypothetical protein